MVGALAHRCNGQIKTIAIDPGNQLGPRLKGLQAFPNIDHLIQLVDDPHDNPRSRPRQRLDLMHAADRHHVPTRLGESIQLGPGRGFQGIKPNDH
jgi:hypothetical protein